MVSWHWIHKWCYRKAFDVRYIQRNKHRRSSIMINCLVFKPGSKSMPSMMVFLFFCGSIKYMQGPDDACGLSFLFKMEIILKQESYNFVGKDQLLKSVRGFALHCIRKEHFSTVRFKHSTELETRPTPV